jgi:hypothetical protein
MINQPTVSADSLTTNDFTHENDVMTITSNETNTCNLGLIELPHSAIRAKAADVYLARATRQQHAHQLHLQLLREKCNVGDFVGLQIHKVDRTNTDPKLLPCKIIVKEEDQVKLACVNGIIDQWWPINVCVGLSAVPEELVQIQVDDLPEISMITASKLYVRGAVNGVCCSCKGGCKTKQCACMRNQVFCSTKCHKNTRSCKNMEK